MNLPVIRPEWPVPETVAALVTTRKGGVSSAAWQSLNLGLNCGDSSECVKENRSRLLTLLPDEPKWMRQVHGSEVIGHDGVAQRLQTADAIYSCSVGEVCAVLTADCLPVLFADRNGGCVAAAHAGWRGLAAGVLEHTIESMPCEAGDIVAWLGPGIGAAHYQVGDDVRAALINRDPAAESAFRAVGDRWLADLCQIAEQRLGRVGVREIFGGGFCTYSEADRFFSHRRDGETGRMAALIWLQDGTG